MKAIYIKEPGQIEFIDVEKPVRKRDEVLLRLLYGGIYGSDPSSYEGTFVCFNYPRIPGHEFSAEVVEADEDNEQGLRLGVIVAYSPYFSCGRCYSYENGIINTYMNNQTMGCQRDSAFQEYITVPSKRVYDRKGVDPMLLAVIEPFCIGYCGVGRAEVGTGERMLVIGTETIGVLAAVVVKAKGALIYMSDVSRGESKITRAFGVDGAILNSSPENFERTANDITEGNGFDTAIKTVGLPFTFQNRIDAACSSGKVVVIGIGKENLDSNFTLPQKKELSVFGSRNALEKDFVELIDLVKSGETPIESTITGVYEFENGAEAFYGFAHNPGDMLKAVIDFTGN